jgi:hypothetical protein
MPEIPIPLGARSIPQAVHTHPGSEEWAAEGRTEPWTHCLPPNSQGD